MAEQTRRAFSRLFGDPGVTYMLSGAFTLAAVSFFSDRSVAARTTVGEAVAPFDACWNLLYLIGGALTLVSWLARTRQIDHEGFLVEQRLHNDRRWEGGALIALAGGFALNGGTAIAIQGLDDVRSYVFAIFVAGCAARLRRVWRTGR